MTRVIKVAVLLAVIIVGVGVLSLRALGARAAPSSGKVIYHQDSGASCGSWRLVASPNVRGASGSGLSGVAAVSADDVWAVGSAGGQQPGGQTLIEHWNGTNWQIVASPNPGAEFSQLAAVAAVSSNDIWAVGLQVNTPGVTQTLIEHWNGTSWSVVPSPSPGAANNELLGVSAASANDVWAVGFINTSTTGETLIEHWNGTKWSVVPSPNPKSSQGVNNGLSGVAAISATDAWAVGSGVTISGETLIEHWNGSRWSLVTSPDEPQLGGELRAAAAISAGDVWAVGDYVTNSGKSLTEHWNGTSWSVVPSVSVGRNFPMSGVAAISSDDVWTVGSYMTFNGSILTLAEHWNGINWVVAPTLSPGSFYSQLAGVAAVATTDVWAVGHADNHTLIEHFSC
jgi:hypothetical protein